LRGIRRLLYGDGYTIRGVQRILREQGVRTVQAVGQGQAVHLPAPPQDDAQDADGRPNGVPDALKLPLPVDSDASDETEDEVEELEPDDPVSSDFARENQPMAEPNSVAMAPVPTASGAMQARQASLPVAPRPRGMAAEDLDRLKRALAELEACRRLLDKANEGGR
jgi:hypothetical protein